MSRHKIIIACSGSSWSEKWWLNGTHYWVSLFLSLRKYLHILTSCWQFFYLLLISIQYLMENLFFLNSKSRSSNKKKNPSSTKCPTFLRSFFSDFDDFFFAFEEKNEKIPSVHIFQSPIKKMIKKTLRTAVKPIHRTNSVQDLLLLLFFIQCLMLLFRWINSSGTYPRQGIKLIGIILFFQSTFMIVSFW